MIVLGQNWETGKVKLSFHSGHHNNVFLAKFMPFTEDRTIVTGAADGQIRVVHILERGSVETALLAKHDGRAHKLAVEPGSPHIFYTCGEDGLVQHASEFQNKIDNAGGERLKLQKAKDIDKNGTEINRHKVQMESGQKMIKKLTKGIEDSKKELERLTQEREALKSVFKEIEQKAFTVQENYKKTQELIDQHKDVLDQAKSDYEKLKKTVDGLRTTEVDLEYKLQDMKKVYKESEMKARAYKKKYDELQVVIAKHLDQIKKDAVDPEKFQSTLSDEAFPDTCDLQKALEMVTLLKAQVKEMNLNLDSIAEYRQKVSLYDERVDDLNMVTQQRDDIKKQYDEWRKRRLDEFMAGFNSISLKLKEMYQDPFDEEPEKYGQLIRR